MISPGNPPTLKQDAYNKVKNLVNMEDNVVWSKSNQ